MGYRQNVSISSPPFPEPWWSKKSTNPWADPPWLLNHKCIISVSFTFQLSQFYLHPWVILCCLLLFPFMTTLEHQPWGGPEEILWPLSPADSQCPRRASPPAPFLYSNFLKILPHEFCQSAHRQGCGDAVEVRSHHHHLVYQELEWVIDITFPPHPLMVKEKDQPMSRPTTALQPSKDPNQV